MKSKEIITVLEEVYTFEDKFSAEEDDFIPLHYVISDRQDFKNWRESAKEALRSCKETPVVQESLELLGGFRDLYEKDDYGELCARIRVIVKHLKEKEALDIKQTQVDMNLPTVFISYNQSSGGEFADDLAKALAKSAVVKRDIDCIQPWESIRSFMNTIREQDFVVLIMTDEYLKSKACMYEVTELMKDYNWTKKVMFAVLEKAIYDTNKRAGYIKYWQDECQEIENSVKNLQPAATSSLSDELKRCTEIANSMGDFLSYVTSSNNPKPRDIIEKILERIERDCQNEPIR